MESYLLYYSKIPMAIIDERDPTNLVVKVSNSEFDSIKNSDTLWRPYIDYAHKYGLYIYKNIYIRHLAEYKKLLVIILPKSSEDDMFESTLGKISHEIRTPLHSIMGFAQLLSNSETMTVSERQYLQTIYASSLHMMDMINNLIQFKDISQGKIQLNITPVDLGEVIQKSIDIVKGNNKHDISLYYEKTSINISADRNLLQQVLINILQNAVDYNVPNGSVTVNVLCPPGGLTISIIIKDTGIGMTREKIEQVLMTRKHGKTKQIGLYLSREFIEHMSGTLTIEPNETMGVCVCITIPIVNRVNHIHTPPSTPIPITHNYIPRQILIVEDDKNSIDLIKIILEDRVGMKPDELVFVSTTSDAIKLLSTTSQQFDLVILDYHLPDNLGSVIIPYIKPSSTIIVISADINKFKRLELKRMGVVEIINKPLVSVESFAQTILYYLALKT